MEQLYTLQLAADEMANLVTAIAGGVMYAEHMREGQTRNTFFECAEECLSQLAKQGFDPQAHMANQLASLKKEAADAVKHRSNN